MATNRSLVDFETSRLAFSRPTRRSATRLRWCVGLFAFTLTLASPAFADERGVSMVVGLEGGETVTLPIAADTFLTRGHDKNNGTAGLLVLRDNDYAVCLIKPDLAPLADIDAERIESAALHMRVGWREREGSASIRAHRMRTAWNEKATWSRPRPGEDDEGAWKGPESGTDFDPEPVARLEMTEAPIGPIAIEGLEPAVKEWLTNNASAHGLILRFFGDSVQLNLDSRESGS